MKTIRLSNDRGHAEHGWLQSRHTFSFADYHDPAHMGFRALRVINEDRVIAGAGFPTHPHRDMEIISYVVSGALEHKDSMGNGSIIRPGDVQRMTAGTGVTHSEYNHSQTEPVHFLQIWIVPQTRGLAPSYEQRSFTAEERRGRLRLVASPDGADGSLTVHQDVRLYTAVLEGGQEVTHTIAPGRGAWLQVVSGTLRSGEHTLGEGDGLAVTDEEHVTLAAIDSAHALLFDLA